MFNLLRKAVDYVKNVEFEPLDDDYDEMYNFDKDSDEGFLDVTGSSPISRYNLFNYFEDDDF